MLSVKGTRYVVRHKSLKMYLNIDILRWFSLVFHLIFNGFIQFGVESLLIFSDSSCHSFIYLWGIFKDVTLMHSILLLPFYSPRGWSNKSVKIKYILILSITFESDRHKSDPADTACHSIKLSIKKTPINPKGQVTHAAVLVSPLKQLCNNAPITIKELLRGN